jgi:hypothetical protein
MLKALEYSKLLDQGLVNSQAELARKENVNRARITQILNLFKLAPKIQEYLSNLTDEKQIRYFTERRLRQITKIPNYR